MSITRRFAITGAVVAVAISGLAACTSPNSAEGGGDAKTIALLLPESKTTRYESFDRPIFEKTVKKECPDCVVKYYNADQDEAKQAQQMETALSAGAKVTFSLILALMRSVRLRWIMSPACSRLLT